MYVLSVAQSKGHKKAMEKKKSYDQVDPCLARTKGSDITNLRIPGRKWHTVESLRGLESHRTSCDVEYTHDRKLFHTLGTNSSSCRNVPPASLSQWQQHNVL